MTAMLLICTAALLCGAIVAEGMNMGMLYNNIMLVTPCSNGIPVVA